MLRAQAAGARGLVPGDRILSVNGVPADSVSFADVAAQPGPVVFVLHEGTAASKEEVVRLFGPPVEMQHRGWLRWCALADCIASSVDSLIQN